MTYIQCIFHTIFLFVVLSTICDKIVAVLSYALNYIINLPIFLIVKNQKVLSIISIIISISLNLCTVYFLSEFLIHMTNFAEYNGLNKTIFLLLGCILFQYMSITALGTKDKDCDVIIEKYHTFCLFAYVPLFLTIYYLNIYVFYQPIFWVVQVFYKLLSIKIIGYLLNGVMGISVFAILFHILLMLVASIKLIKAKINRE